MGYATVFHVEARNTARGTYTDASKPTATQVVQFIDEAAGQLDAWLLNSGYDTPFASYIASQMIGSSGLALLQRWNSIGAALAVEEAAQQSTRVEFFQKMWLEVEAACQKEDLPFPVLAGKAFPRGFGESRGTAPCQEFNFDHTTPIGVTGYWDL